MECLENCDALNGIRKNSMKALPINDFSSVCVNCEEAFRGYAEFCEEGMSRKKITEKYLEKQAIRETAISKFQERIF